MTAGAPTPQRLAELGLAAFNPDVVRHQFPALRLLVLFGSRARGEAHAASDWDFGYLADPTLDVDALLELLCKVVNSDDVDLVNLDRASGVLRHQAADHGIAVFEHMPETFVTYVIDVLRFWLDAWPVIRKSQEEQLRSLG